MENFWLEVAYFLLAVKLIGVNGMIKLVKFILNKEKVNFGDILRSAFHAVIITCYLYIAIPHYKAISYNETFSNGVKTSLEIIKNGLLDNLISR
jgi:hypothetical protein